MPEIADSTPLPELDAEPRRTRRRLARTLTRARWGEYRNLLAIAWAAGYTIVPVEEWLLQGGASEEPTLLLRHDVDQHPRSALRMAAIEHALDVRSTWYFRWRTADRRVIRKLRSRGHSVGLHYETATRLVLEGRAAGFGPNERRTALNREVSAFESRFGPIHSISPHGDTRVPQITNTTVTEGIDLSTLGIDLDATQAMRGRRIAYWLTDRSHVDGAWSDGIDPAALFEQGLSPILCLTHPNNWVGGPALWHSRARLAVSGGARRLASRGRLGPDTPPRARRPAARTGMHGSPFSCVAASLEELVAREGRLRGLNPDVLLSSLDTNARLVEERGRLIIDELRDRLDRDNLARLRIADLGCGFGALSLLLSTHGASVVGIDSKGERLGVAREVARRHGIRIEFVQARIENSMLVGDRFDVVLLNNSLCYLVDRSARLTALNECRRILHSEGILVVRNPNRLRLRDPFTGLPLIHLLPPGAAVRSSQVLGRERSFVRLRSPWGITRELRRAGFRETRHFSSTTYTRPGVLRPFGGFQNVSARTMSLGVSDSLGNSARGKRRERS